MRRNSPRPRRDDPARTVGPPTKWVPSPRRAARVDPPRHARVGEQGWRVIRQRRGWTGSPEQEKFVAGGVSEGERGGAGSVLGKARQGSGCHRGAAGVIMAIRQPAQQEEQAQLVPFRSVGRVGPTSGGHHHSAMDHNSHTLASYKCTAIQ
jgi:hypothetical protein